MLSSYEDPRWFHFPYLSWWAKGCNWLGFPYEITSKCGTVVLSSCESNFDGEKRYSDGVSNAVKFCFHPCPRKWSKLTNAFTEGKNRCLHEDGFMLRGYVWFWESNCAIWFCTSKKWRHCLGVCCFWCWCGRNIFLKRGFYQIYRFGWFQYI